MIADAIAVLAAAEEPPIITAARQLLAWHLAYDIQSPAPGEPMRTQRGPAKTKVVPDPANDPMGNLSGRPYDYSTMVSNLVSHYHGANDDERKQGRLWYRAAHDMFHKFAKDNDISPERAVAYGAAFSPLTDWGDNVHHAQQFMFGYRPGDPDFNPHNWQTAHINPKALDAFRQQAGRDPTHSDEDLHALADLHSDSFKRGPSLSATNDLSNPDARANWMQNIQHHGMDKILTDHEGQALATYKKPGHPEYNPAHSMRASGIKTLGGNIQKAKDLYHAPEDVAQMFGVLGGPKISHFTDNILDDTPIDSEGYYQHPNGDWAQNKDLGGTIDSHHIRASSMPHGGWTRAPYASKNPNTDHEYDVFNRGLLDATTHINSQQPDATKHITPKQLQATVWLKHKNDKDYFERQRNPQSGQLIKHESELGGAARPADWQFAEKSYKSKGKGLGKGPSGKAPKAAALDEQDFQDMPPLWRKMFMGRMPVDWTSLLSAWVNHNTPPDQSESEHQAAVVNDARKLLLAVPKDPSAQWGADVMRSVTRQPGPPGQRQRQYPGVTVHDTVGDAPTSGYMVSLPQHEQEQSMSQLTPQHINDYVRQNADTINSHPDNYYGGWGDEEGETPRYYHDVSRNVQDPWEAAGNALQWNQKAVYDVANEDAPRTPEFWHDQIAKGGRRHTQ